MSDSTTPLEGSGFATIVSNSPSTSFVTNWGPKMARRYRRRKLPPWKPQGLIDIGFGDFIGALWCPNLRCDEAHGFIELGQTRYVQCCRRWKVEAVKDTELVHRIIWSIDRETV